jgi:hypothetical protein
MVRRWTVFGIWKGYEKPVTSVGVKHVCDFSVVKGHSLQLEKWLLDVG